MSDQLSLLQHICNTLGAYIFAKDAQGRYIYANQEVLDLFGKPESQVLGQDDSAFFDLNESSEIIENDKQAMETRQAVITEEGNFLKGASEQRIYRIVKKPLINEHDEVVGICGIAYDITEEKRLRDIVNEQKELLNVVLDNMQAHVYMKDEQRRFLYVNPPVAELFGLPVEQIIGQKEQDILPSEVAEHFHQSDKQVFKQNKPQRIEETMSEDDGTVHHYLSVKVPVTMNGCKSLIGFSTDVSEIFKLKEQFKHLANTDSLTGLFNRRYFTQRAESIFAREKAVASDLALISIDIDHFKAVNDTFGHPAGDKVLQIVADKLSSALRSDDILARIGGEEFAILLRNTPLEQAFNIAQRLCEQQRNLQISLSESKDITVTFSIGVTLMKQEDLCFDEMFSRVDKALYQAKHTGRDRVVRL